MEKKFVITVTYYGPQSPTVFGFFQTRDEANKWSEKKKLTDMNDVHMVDVCEIIIAKD